MLVGIAGPSCSGKTTLARKIAQLLDAPLLHLDGHFRYEAPRMTVGGYPSFESPDLYDGAALLAETKAAIKVHADVVVEGFLLFAYPGFEEICDRRVFLDVPHGILVERRLARAAMGRDDVRGGWDPRAEEGWHVNGRDEWERNGAFQRDLVGIEIVRAIEHGGTHPLDPAEAAAALVEGWRERV